MPFTLKRENFGNSSQLLCAAHGGLIASKISAVYSEAVWARGVCSQRWRTKAAPRATFLFFKCWQEINSPKSEFCFSLHPSVPGAQASPMPTLPLLLSGINHSFHLLAAVDTILTRCEMQLRNNSDLTVFFFFLFFSL